jgi:predicted O-methyltransferase YrrM
MRQPVFHRMFGYNLALLPNTHLASLEAGVSDVESAREKTGATIGYPGWGLIYHVLLSHLDRTRDEILIETGSNQGCTSIVLAQALIDANCRGRVITFEMEPANVAKAKANYAAAGVADRIDIHQGDVHHTLSEALAPHKGIRFAFLDASHLFKDIMFEFETLLPHLAQDALVMFDNTYQIAEGAEDSRVNGALKHIIMAYGGNLINFENVSWFTPGLAMWQRTPAL